MFSVCPFEDSRLRREERGRVQEAGRSKSRLETGVRFRVVDSACQVNGSELLPFRPPFAFPGPLFLKTADSCEIIQNAITAVITELMPFYETNHDVE